MKHRIQIARYAVANRLRQMRNAAPGLLAHLLFFFGLGAVSYGAGMIYKPLEPIVGGMACVWVSMLWAAEDGSKRGR